MSARRRRAIAITAAAALLIGYGVLVAAVAPDDVEGSSGGLHYRLAEDDDEASGRGHLVVLTAWSDRPSGPLSATLRHRDGMDGPFTERRMQPLQDGRTFAATIPPLPEGHRAFYYLEVHGAGAAATVPTSAPDGPLLYVRWEDPVNPLVLALHITLMISPLFFLLHAIHYASLAARGQPGYAAKVHAGVRWGWLCFFAGGIPLGIYVSGTALGWDKAWGGWPLGSDITDTKTELLALYWAVVLALRADLLPAIGRGLRPLAGDRAFARLVLGGAALTAAVYLIPHSFFFQ